MTIVQQSPSFVVAPATENEPTTSEPRPRRKSGKLPPPPVNPCKDIKFKDMTDETWLQFGEWSRQYHAWEKEAAEVGRVYDPFSVWRRETEAYETLMDWLEAVGAPEEILTIARGERRLTYAYLTNANHWHRMHDMQAADVAEYMPAVYHAIRTVRKLLKVAKR